MNDASNEIIYLEGLRLECETIEDSFEKAIAEYEFPYRDGALLEDLGTKARQIRIRCFFFEESYEDHKDLLNLLEGRSLFDLFHPKYGLVSGAIKTVSVRHDDRLRTAEIDLTFVENLKGPSEVTRVIDAEAGVEESFTTSLSEQDEELSDDVADDLAAAGKGSAEGATVLAKTLDPALPVADQVTGISFNTREYLKEIDANVAEFEALQADNQNPATSLLATLAFEERLPGRIIGSLSRTVERYARANDSLQAFPARYLDAVKRELSGISAAFEAVSVRGKASSRARATMAKHLRIVSAQRLALEAAYLYKADEADRIALRRSEGKRSFDELGNYMKQESPPSILSMHDLERTLGSVRESIQAALEKSRRMDSLKAMARALLEYINVIKLERERIVAVTLANPMPLHLVCLKYGLPYNYAERVLSINRIPEPNFAEGAVNVYAR